jgi:outer membrane immunogenic protein
VVAPAPAYNWTGFYLGANLGGEWERIDGNFTLGPGDWSVQNSRGMWDAHVGAQYQWGMLVFGVEGNFVGLFSNNSGGTSSCGAGCAAAAFMSANVVDNMWTIGGRLGGAFGPWMAYLSGGYANTQVDNRFFDVNGFLIESTRTRHNGAYVGGGFDWQVWNTPGGALVAGIEYRHYEFQSVTATPTLVGGGLNTFDNWAIKPRADTIEGRLSWLWGGPVVARY